ncbi:flagellar assembly protein FliW [Paenibacillus psychroresistens]|uniref:Flagellar assembly factor FliW n=1 Tax=Paenibacillus psychroresistens TaxID=1778678 RepID=A0A6B8RB33_9BACL|nr:flagellar assembly protein FliW [Paenibacillus psychroresistens]QGQ93520.1 flagellar assembly protein FliW [Paenibacillus psychroresistens]
MIVNTQSFGELDIDPKDVYEFTSGIPGFEDNQRYIIVQPDPEMQFCYIQSIEVSSLAFLVCNPFLFYADYDFQLSDACQQELNIENEADVAVWTVVTIDRQNNEVTLNLLAPIVVNVRDKRGKQIILHDSDYETKHKLSLPNSEQAAATEEGL